MNSNCNSFLPGDASKKGMRKMSEINIILFEVHRKEVLATISELRYPSSINRALQEYGELIQQWVKIQAILTAAKNLEKYDTVDYPGITSWNDAVDVLLKAVRNYKEWEAKDA